MQLTCNKKPIFVSNLQEVNKILQNEPVSTTFWLYGDRYSIQYYYNDMTYLDIKSHNQIIIQKTKTIWSGWWYEVYENWNIISNVYFTIQNEEDYIRFVIFNISNCDFYNYDKDNIPEGVIMLSEEESYEILASLIQYIKIIAKQKKKNKLIIYVKEKNYIKYFEKKGFILTGNKNFYNDIEIELSLQDEYLIK